MTNRIRKVVLNVYEPKSTDSELNAAPSSNNQPYYSERFEIIDQGDDGEAVAVIALPENITILQGSRLFIDIYLNN